MAQSPPLPPCPPEGDRAVAPPLPIVGPRDRAEAAAPHEVRELPPPPKAAAPPPLPPETAAEPSPAHAPSWWSDEGAARSSAWLVSFVVHAVALFLLGLITLSAHSGGKSLGLLAWTGDGNSSDAASAPGDLDQQPAIIAPDGPVVNSPKDAVIAAGPLDLPAETTKVILPVDGPSKIHINRPKAAGAGAGTAREWETARAMAVAARQGSVAAENRP